MDRADTASHWDVWGPDDDAAAALFARLFGPGTAPPRRGDRIADRYEIIEPIGQGGMGQVFRARDTRLHRTIAIKVLTSPSLGARPTVATGVAEGTMLARLDHPRIVAVYDTGRWRGYPFVAMALIDGEPLDQALHHGPFGLELALEVAEQVCAALTHAHAQGVVHRDIKPGNLMLCADGAHLLDFGVAFAEGVADGCAGTPAYAAPEQWDPAARPDARVDVHGVGALLFEMLTEIAPFATAPNDAREPPPFALLEDDPAIPSAVVALLRRCLDPDPLGRPADGAALGDEIATLRSSLLVDGPADSAPYRYFAAFDETHARWFHGREAEVSALERAVRAAPLAVITGPSGAGKSSLIAAGLIPRLRRSAGGWDVTSMTPGRQPWARLCEALALPTDVTDLRGAVLTQIRRREGRLLIVVDQFEELYTHGVQAHERARFWAALGHLGDDQRAPLRVLIAVRADFLAHAELPTALRSSLLRAAHVIERPDRASMRAALIRPAQAHGVHFEAGLAEEIVAELAGDATPLPLLQLVASALWTRRDPEARAMTHADLAALGGIDGLFSRHADRVIATLPAQQVPVARAALCALVTEAGTRQRRGRAELMARLDPDCSEAVLSHLVAGHLVSADADGLTLAHEAVVERWGQLRRWLVEAPDARRRFDALTDAARAWRHAGERPGLLWRGAELAAAERLCAAHGARLPTLVEAFLEAALSRQRRARRGTAAVAALAAIGVLAFVVYVIVANATLRREQALAQVALANEAAERGDLLSARQRLREALSHADTLPARAAWWRVERQPERWRVPVGGIGFGAALAHDGSFAVAVGQDQNVYVIDTATALSEPLRAAATRGQLYDVAISPDDRRILVGGAGQILEWTRQGDRWVEAAQRTFSAGTIRAVAISPDGAWSAAADVGGRVAVWRADDAIPQVIRGATDIPVRGLTFSATELLAASSDGAVWAWRLDGGGTRTVLEASGHGVAELGRQHQAGIGFDATGTRVALAFYDGGHGVEEVDLRTRTRRIVVDGLPAPVVLTRYLPPDRAADPDASWIGVATLGDRLIVHGPAGPMPIFEFAGGVRDVATHRAPGAGRLSWFVVGNKASTFHRMPTGGDRAPDGPPGARYDMRFSSDGAWFAFGSLAGGEARILRRSTRDGARLSATALDPMRPSMLALSPDDRWFAVGGRTKRLELGRFDGSRQLFVDEPSGGFGAIAFLDEETLLAGTADGSVRVHDLVTDRALSRTRFADPTARRPTWETSVRGLVVREARAVLVQQYGQISRLTVPDGGEPTTRAPHAAAQRVWSGGHLFPGTLTVAGNMAFASDADAGILRFVGPDFIPIPWGASTSNAYGLAAVPGQPAVVAAHRDGTVQLHHAVSAFTLGSHVSEANAVTVSPDGRLALSAGDDDTLRAWDLETLRPAWRAPLLLPAPPRILSHRGWSSAPAPDDDPWAKLTALHHLDVERAALAADGEWLCLLRADRLEMYHRGEVVTHVGQPGVTATVRAALGQCLIERDGEARHVTADGVTSRRARRALGGDGVHLALLAGGVDGQRWIERIDHGGALRRIREVAADERPTAWGEIAGWQITGFETGPIEIRKDGVRHRLRRRARAATTHLRAGPVGTLLAGHADGWVELWDLARRAPLHAERMNGRVQHLHVQGTSVIAVSESGDHLRWFLDPFVEDHAQLKARIRAEVPE